MQEYLCLEDLGDKILLITFKENAKKLDGKDSQDAFEVVVHERLSSERNRVICDCEAVANTMFHSKVLGFILRITLSLPVYGEDSRVGLFNVSEDDKEFLKTRGMWCLWYVFESKEEALGVFSF